MALNTYTTFEGKLTSSFKNEIRNLTNFHRSMLRSLKLGTFMQSFYSKQKVFEVKIYRGFLHHDSEE